MDTDHGKTPENKEHHLVHNFKKRCIKKLQRDPRSCLARSLFSATVCSNMIEMKMFVVNGTILQNKISLYRMSESEYFHYRQNCWISFKKSGNTTEPIRKRSDFNQALSRFKTVMHREAGGRQLMTHAVLEEQWKSWSSSSSTLGCSGANHGGLLENSNKVNKRGLWSNGANCCLQIFGENLRRRVSRVNSILLQINRLQMTSVHSNTMCAAT